MRNQKLETELAYKSAKCNTLRKCGVITDRKLITRMSLLNAGFAFDRLSAVYNISLFTLSDSSV